MSENSTLGTYLAYKNSIENVAVKARATENTDLHYSVWLSDGHGPAERVYASEVQLLSTSDYHWLQLPVNLYTDKQGIAIEIAYNSKVDVAEETWHNGMLHRCSA